MTDLKQIFLVFEYARKLSEILTRIRANLEDVAEWAVKVPGPNTPVHQILAWTGKDTAWEDHCAERLAMLIDIEEILTREGFDRRGENPPAVDGPPAPTESMAELRRALHDQPEGYQQ